MADACLESAGRASKRRGFSVWAGGTAVAKGGLGTGALAVKGALDSGALAAIGPERGGVVAALLSSVGAGVTGVSG